MVTRCRPLPPRLSNPNSGKPSDERPGKLTAPDFETDCGSSQLAITAIQLGTARINLGGDDVGIGKIGAVFYLPAARFFGVKCLLVRPVPPPFPHF